MEHFRKYRHLLLMVILILILILAISTVIALTNNDFDIFWWTVDGGGGTSDGGSFSVRGTAGQPDAGDHSGGDYSLGGGYWSSDKTLVYIPMIMKNFCGGFQGPGETEPDNNSAVTADGPLCLFRTYTGSPDDDAPGGVAELESDYFYINWDGGQFTVTVSKFLTSKAQVNLYYQTTANLKVSRANQASGNYVISYNGLAGKYLIRVVAEAGHAVGNGDYNLRVTVP